MNQNNSPQFEALEERVLLSASPIESTDASSVHAALNLELNTEPVIHATELLLIDTAVSDYEDLIAELDKPNLEIHFINSQSDGVEQISAILKSYSNLDALHIISHGSAGELALGQSKFNSETLGQDSDVISAWSKALSHDADILLYGCNVAEGEAGQDFIRELASLTKADIAASDDLTGYQGDLDLEVQEGSIETDLILDQAHFNKAQITLVDETFDFDGLGTQGAGSTSLTITENGSDLNITSVGDTLLAYVVDGGGVAISGTESLLAGGLGAGITSITFQVNSGDTFDISSIKLQNDLDAQFLDIASNLGAISTNVDIGNGTTPSTVALSTNNVGITSLTITRNGGGNFYLAIDDLVITNITAPNADPAISIDNSTLAFSEGDSATQIDSAATLSDADGDSDWNTGTLVAQITANNEAADSITIPDNIVGTINTDGVNLRNGATVIGTLSASEGTVTNGTDLTITFNANATNALVQQVVRSLHYSNSSGSPGTSDRTVTVTATDTNGGTANDTRTISVAAVNDEPTLTATGSNPTFTEGGAAASLFSSASASTVESGQTLSALSFTVTNVNDGSNEIINVDGTAVVLTHGTAGTTATNSLSYSVSVAGTTATISLSGGTLSTAALQTLIDAMSYQNNSNDANTSNRVITVTSLQDSGGTANSGDDTAALAIASTVTVTAVNDEPTLTATGSNPTFTEGGAAASLFSSASASTVESGQTLSALSFTVTNVNDGSNEILNVDGTAVVLTHATAGTTATNSLSYSVSVAGTTATISLSGGTLSTAALQTLIDGMSYQNNSNDANTSNRVVTVTSLQDSGGTANSGDDTAALAIASTVTVVAVNDEPTLTATGSNPTFTEGGAAASLFSSASASTVESGQTLSALSFTVTNVNDGSNEILNVDGTAVVLTHATAGTTATNSLSYSVSVAGTTATISLSAGTLSTAALQTLIDAMSYQNNSATPNTSNRAVTVTSLQDSGGTANSGDDTAALAIASTVTVVAVNDEPSLTATGSNPTFTEDGAAASLFSSASASTIESGQTLSALSFTVTNVNDGSDEIINVDGTAVVLTHATAGTTATNSLSYSVSVAGTTATISLSAGTLSTAALQTLIDGMSYQNNSSTPNTSNRVITVTSLQDSGGTANSGDDTAALAIASTVTVVAVNDEPSLTATGSNPTFTEGGAAASLFSSASASTVESGQTLSALTFTVTNVNDGSNEIINVDGTAVVLTHATAGTTATNSLSYSVSVAGTTATISLSAGTLSTAALQTLIDAMSYQNNSATLNTSNRVVTVTSLQDSGGTANGGDDTATLAMASTVTVASSPVVAPVNDEVVIIDNLENSFEKQDQEIITEVILQISIKIMELAPLQVMQETVELLTNFIVQESTTQIHNSIYKDALMSIGEILNLNKSLPSLTSQVKNVEDGKNTIDFYDKTSLTESQLKEIQSVIEEADKSLKVEELKVIEPNAEEEEEEESLTLAKFNFIAELEGQAVVQTISKGVTMDELDDRKSLDEILNSDFSIFS